MWPHPTLQDFDLNDESESTLSEVAYSFSRQLAFSEGDASPKFQLSRLISS